MKIDLTNVFVFLAGLNAFARGDIQCYTCTAGANPPECTNNVTCPGDDAQCKMIDAAGTGGCANDPTSDCAADVSNCCTGNLCNPEKIKCICNGTESCPEGGLNDCDAGVTQCLKLSATVQGGCANNPTSDCAADVSNCCTGNLCNKQTATETTGTTGTTGTTKPTPPVQGAAVPAGRLSVAAALLSVLLFCLGFF